MTANDLSLSIEKIVKAPINEVFRAFTNATALREWLCDVATVDSRPGGRIYLYWNTGDFAAGTFSKYTIDKEVEYTTFSNQKPKLVVTRIALSPAGEATTLTLTENHANLDEKEIEMMKKEWESTLKNLVSVLEEGPDLRITTRPMMGIYLDLFDKEIAKELGVPVDQGIRINGVVKGLGAQKAGLKNNDVLIEMAGVPLTGFNDYLVAMQGKVAGDNIKVIFYRGAEKKTVLMELAKRHIPDIPASPAALAEKIREAQLKADKELDAVILPASEEAASRHPAKKEWNTKEILAHLLHYERYLQGWIGEMVYSQESVADDFGGNLDARVQATAEVYGTLKNVYEEFKRNQAEIVACVKNLPDDFARRKSSWWRLCFNLLTYCDHTHEHLNQIKVALSS